MSPEPAGWSADTLIQPRAESRTATAIGLDSLLSQSDLVGELAQLVGRAAARGAQLLVAGDHCQEEARPSGRVVARGTPNSFMVQQLEGRAEAGDVLLLLAAGPPSHALVATAERARELDLEVWSLTGPGPNALAGLSKGSIAIEAPDPAAVHHIHAMVVRTLLAALGPNDDPGSARAGSVHA